MKHLTQLNSWQQLIKHAKELEPFSLTEIKNNHRSTQKIFSNTACQIEIDFTNQRITQDTLALLVDLANESHLNDKIEHLFNGSIVNPSENRPALHTALRQLKNTSLMVEGKDVIAEISAVRKEMQAIAESIRNEQWYGYSGRPITDIVNIGIGGSDLGPRFCISALSNLTHKNLKFHFITSVDPHDFESVVEKLNPENTLFLISSKSFTTKETLQNAKKAVKWLGLNRVDSQHFIAVTANVEKAKQLGFERILPIWSWVGGRYSLCSAINLITMIAIGPNHFGQILAGANRMDEHFLQTPLIKNLPVLLGLIGVWNNNFLHINNFLILAYAQQFEYFVPYIQQLDMESNGKSVDIQGNRVNYATGPLVWGGLGNQAQHSYFQLLCQGTHRIAGDCIGIKAYKNEIINHFLDAKLKVLTEGVPHTTQSNKDIPGNLPLNLIALDEITPYTLGALIALYEHKIYTQSVIWNINPFDQPGVESAKQNFLNNKVLATELMAL